MVPGQRRDRHRRRIGRVEPQDFRDLGAGRGLARDRHPIDRGHHLAPGFVGRRGPGRCRGSAPTQRRWRARVPRRVRGQRRKVVLAGLAFSSRLHEDRGTPLAHQQVAAVVVADDRRHDRDRRRLTCRRRRTAASAARRPCGGCRPRWRKAAAESMRPRGVRWTRPCWMRKGSTISSIASRGSDSAAAIVSMPTGPPPKLSAIRLEIAPVERVEAERIDLEPARAPGRRPWRRSPRPSRPSAKSRTRRRSRVAMRGVPRERRAISVLPASVRLAPRMRAPRRTMCSSSCTS